MAETVTLSTKGQIVIPLPIREQLHLEPGAKLFVEMRGNEIVLKTGADWKQFRGSLRAPFSLTQALEEERASDKKLEDCLLG